MMSGVCIFSSPSVPCFAFPFRPPSHGGCSFYRSLFFFFFRREEGRGERERERGTRQCPSEKSINLARGLANVRTIRQRADWGWDSWRSRGKEGRGLEIRVPEPVSGERCSFVPHAIKPRRFYERGEPDDEVIYLPYPTLPGVGGMKRRRE